MNKDCPMSNEDSNSGRVTVSTLATTAPRSRRRLNHTLGANCNEAISLAGLLVKLSCNPCVHLHFEQVQRQRAIFK
jgi:hypothetical protein